MAKQTTNTAILQRYKSTEPFSQSLNKWVESEFEKIAKDFIIGFVSYDPYEDAEQMFNDMDNGVMMVSNLYCNNTIFGSPEINCKFRVVHDFLHYKHKLSFSVSDECKVNHYQTTEAYKAKLSKFDIALLNIETVGQVIYYDTNNDFPTNQRDFTIQQLKDFGY